MEDSLLMQWAATMGVSMVPILELRGAIPFGLALGLPPGPVYVVSVIGNMIPVPAVMLLLRHVLRWLRTYPFWGKKITWLEKRTHIKGRLVQRYRMAGLILLVAIPLPGTGAWTGAMVATLLRIRLRLALPAILLGVVIAGAVTLAIASGVLALWI